MAAQLPPPPASHTPELEPPSSFNHPHDLDDDKKPSPASLHRDNYVEDDDEVRQREMPPLDWSSLGAFWPSAARRLRATFTRRFIYCLLAGQIISWCITSTNAITTELVNNRSFSLPTTQTLPLYISLFVVYTPYTMYRYGPIGWFKLVLKDGWKYALLGACDVEGNFLVVKAYQYTTLLQCQILDAWAIPVCMFFSYILVKTRFRWMQIVGVGICIVGLGLLVASDQLTDKDFQASNPPLGAGYMVAGASLYGFTNALEEFLVRKRPLYEVVGQLGMWGSMWNVLQAGIIEHKDWRSTQWTGPVIGFLALYTLSLFILYTLAPLLYRSASSTFYNLSIISSDFFGLLIGIGVFGYRPYWLYFVAFVVVIVGLVVYAFGAPIEAHGELRVERPAYAHEVGDGDLERAVATLGKAPTV